MASDQFPHNAPNAAKVATFRVTSVTESGSILSDRLANLRASKSQSLQHVADAVGVSKAHIWELERGSSDNPGLKLLRALAQHFGCSVAYLIGEISTPQPVVVPQYNGTPESDALREVDVYLSCSLRAQREAEDFAKKAQERLDLLWGRRRESQ